MKLSFLGISAESRLFRVLQKLKSELNVALKQQTRRRANLFNKLSVFLK